MWVRNGVAFAIVLVISAQENNTVPYTTEYETQEYSSDLNIYTSEPVKQEINGTRATDNPPQTTPTSTTEEEIPNTTRSQEIEVLFPYVPSENEDLKKVEITYGCPVVHSLACVSKCCDLRESHGNREQLRNGTVCVPNPNYDDFFVDIVDCPNCNYNVGVINRYEYFIGIPCKENKYVLEPEKYPEDVYSIYSNGSLYNRKTMFSMSDYCVDTVDGEFKVFFCFESASQGEIEFFHILYPVGQIISIFFLIITGATYLGIEQFRDLKGKSLVCHIFCLTLAFTFLATVQLTGNYVHRSFCVIAAFVIQFSFVACFFWLNVLSYDTYRNIRDHFRSTKYSKLKRQELGLPQPRSEIRQFTLYSIYAWIGPLVLLVVSLVLDNVPGIPDTFLKPNFGVKSCWFGSETAALPYFFGPMGLLLGINLVFFSLSAYTVFKERKAEHRAEMAKDTDDDDIYSKKKKKWRRMLRPYIKGMKQCIALFLIMGLSWFTEIISWAVGGSRYIWVSTDVINTLQGLLIFYVFVVRPRDVRKAIKERLTKWWGIVTHCDVSYKPVHQVYRPAPVNFVVDGPVEELPGRDEYVLATFKPD